MPFGSGAFRPSFEYVKADGTFGVTNAFRQRGLSARKAVAGSP